MILDREGMGGTLTLAESASIDSTASIDTSGDVVIGERVVICEDVLIFTHAHGADPFDKSAITASPLAIGDRAFIGARAIILPRVSAIGEGAVIGAGSVVTHDVSPNVTVAGNPARPIDHR